MRCCEKTPQPPYYAVIFSSERTDGDQGYAEIAEEMVKKRGIQECMMLAPEYLIFSMGTPHQSMRGGYAILRNFASSTKLPKGINEAINAPIEKRKDHLFLKCT